MEGFFSTSLNFMNITKNNASSNEHGQPYGTAKMLNTLDKLIFCHTIA